MRVFLQVWRAEAGVRSWAVGLGRCIYILEVMLARGVASGLRDWLASRPLPGRLGGRGLGLRGEGSESGVGLEGQCRPPWPGRGLGGLDAWVNFSKAPGTLEQPFRNEQLSSELLFRALIAPVRLGGSPIHQLSPAQPFTPCALTAFLPPHLPPHVYEQPAHTRVSMCHPMSHAHPLHTCDSAAQPRPSAAFGGTPHIHDIPHASRPDVMAGCPQLPGPAHLSAHTSWAQGSGPPTAEMGPPSRAYEEGC